MKFEVLNDSPEEGDWDSSGDSDGGGCLFDGTNWAGGGRYNGSGDGDLTDSGDGFGGFDNEGHGYTNGDGDGAYPCEDITDLNAIQNTSVKELFLPWSPETILHAYAYLNATSQEEKDAILGLVELREQK